MERKSLSKRIVSVELDYCSSFPCAGCECEQRSERVCSCVCIVYYPQLSCKYVLQLSLFKIPCLSVTLLSFVIYYCLLKSLDAFNTNEPGFFISYQRPITIQVFISIAPSLEDRKNIQTNNQ